MKRIRCPKCDNAITFDETQYEPGRILVFECSDCHKQFKIRIPERAIQEEEEEEALPTPGSLVVIENAFHFKQTIPLVEGENVIGRFVKGTKANAPIKTVDPSVDNTHCIITARQKGDEWQFLLRDARSTTGTVYMDRFLRPKEQALLGDSDIITIGATTMIFRLQSAEEEA